MRGWPCQAFLQLVHWTKSGCTWMTLRHGVGKSWSGKVRSQPLTFHEIVNSRTKSKRLHGSRMPRFLLLACTCWWRRQDTYYLCRLTGPLMLVFLKDSWSYTLKSAVMIVTSSFLSTKNMLICFMYDVSVRLSYANLYPIHVCSLTSPRKWFNLYAYATSSSVP